MGNSESDLNDFFFRRLINKKNFTYRVLIKVIDFYLRKGNRVLDAGCGEGNLSMYMGKSGASVLGVDVSVRAIEICREKARRLGLSKKISFSIIDIVKERIKDQFDLIVCTEVLEHIELHSVVIGKLRELLRRNAILIVSTPSKNAPLYRLGMTKREDKRAGHLRRYTMEELTGLLKDAGLKIIETRKTEGIFRNFLFYNRLGRLPLRLANRFWLVSDIFTFIDNITLKLFGESQLIVVAQKPKIKGK